MLNLSAYPTSRHRDSKDEAPNSTTDFVRGELAENILENIGRESRPKREINEYMYIFNALHKKFLRGSDWLGSDRLHYGVKARKAKYFLGS